AFAPDGQTLAIGGSDRFIRLWSIRSGKVTDTLRRVDPGSNVAVALAPDGRTLAEHMSYEWSVALWDMPTRTRKGALDHPAAITAFAIAPIGSTVAVSYSEKANADAVHVIQLWDLAGTKRAALRGHGGVVRALAFAADAPLLVSGSDDRTVRVWETSGA